MDQEAVYHVGGARLHCVGGTGPVLDERRRRELRRRRLHPGYWKNHVENWEEISPDTTLGNLGTRVPGWTFGDDNAEYADRTGLEALNAQGGSGITEPRRYRSPCRRDRMAQRRAVERFT